MNKTFKSLVVGDRIFILVVTAGQPTILVKRIIGFEDYSSMRYIFLDPKYRLSILIKEEQLSEVIFVGRVGILLLVILLF